MTKAENDRIACTCMGAWFEKNHFETSYGDKETASYWLGYHKALLDILPASYRDAIRNVRGLHTGQGVPRHTMDAMRDIWHAQLNPAILRAKREYRKMEKTEATF